MTEARHGTSSAGRPLSLRSSGRPWWPWLVAAALLMAAHGWPVGATDGGHPKETTFVCPMHPDVTSTTAGTCSQCGMALVKSGAADPDAYVVDLETSPSPPVPGQATRLRFTVRHPKTGAVVRQFAIVHERPFHVFVLSQDLDHYDHVHPVQQSDGSYTLDTVLPRAGHYIVYSDFLPTGGTPQVVAGEMVTAGAPPGAIPRLTPDRDFTQEVDGSRVTLALPSGGIVAGREASLRYEVADSRTGAPVRDLQPYLGAFGHTLILSEDASHYVHAHPEGKVGRAGGPALVFHALFPEAGRYRIWTQIKRRGVVSTAVFTVAVAEPSTTTGSQSRR